MFHSGNSLAKSLGTSLGSMSLPIALSGWAISLSVYDDDDEALNIQKNLRPSEYGSSSRNVMVAVNQSLE